MQSRGPGTGADYVGGRSGVGLTQDELRFGLILIPMLRSTIVWAFPTALRVQKSRSMNSSSSSSSLNGPISSSQERLLLPLQRLTPHSLSRRVRDLLTGDLDAHRDLPVDADDEPETTTPKSAPVQAPSDGGYGAAEVAAASELRRRDLYHLAGITDVLTDVEQRADELNRTAAELVVGWLYGMRWPRSLRWPSVLRKPSACRLLTYY